MAIQLTLKDDAEVNLSYTKSRAPVQREEGKKCWEKGTLVSCGPSSALHRKILEGNYEAGVRRTSTTGKYIFSGEMDIEFRHAFCHRC